MKKMMKQLMCLSTSAIFLYACQKEDENIGLNSNLDRTAVLDTTIEITTSTVRGRDNFETGLETRLLVGNWSKGDSLTTSCKTFFQLNLENENVDYGENIECDSIIMLLDYSYYYYGDTNATQDIEVYELTEFFQESTDSSYLNTDELAVSGINLSTTTVNGIKPYTDDTLKLYLDQTFGKELLDSASSKDNETFVNTSFPGLSIQATNTSGRGYIMGINPYYSSKSNTRIVVYYRSDAATDGDSVIFNFSDRHRFNNISATFGADLSDLQVLNTASVGDAVLSTETNNICYFQAGSGFYTKVELSGLENYLDSLSKNFTDVIITDASLVVYTEEELSSEHSERPVDYASLYEDDNIDGDDENDLVLQNEETSPTNTSVTNSLYVLYDDSSSYAYNFDITNYVRALNNGNKEQYNLLLGASVRSLLVQRDKNTINSSRVFNESTSNGNKAMHLRLTYTYSLKQ